MNDAYTRDPEEVGGVACAAPPPGWNPSSFNGLAPGPRRGPAMPSLWHTHLPLGVPHRANRRIARPSPPLCAP